MSLAARKAAARTLADVYTGRASLDEALEKHLSTLPDEHRPWVRSTCFETLRHYFNIRAHWQTLVKKPPGDPLALAILDLGCVQILHLKTPGYAAVNESVKLTRALKKPYLSGLVNSVLRKIDKSPALPKNRQSPETRWNHPRWWIEKLRQQWPEHWQTILQAGNHKGPFWLRHNLHHPAALAALQQTCPEARQHPHIESAWSIAPCPVETIPGFLHGHFSVQDAHAQLAGKLLAPENTHRILDACAAPGGKTGHLWELAPNAEIVAADVQAHRLERIRENLKRLTRTQSGRPIQLIQANMAQPDQWPADWSQAGFDRILLDVPCTASGVARRHPDIKLRRTPTDIERITLQQAAILAAAASVLKPNGLLLYATCSVFDEENEQQVSRFLQQHPEFESITPALPFGLPRPHGVQLFPDINGGDGFYYALLKKCP